MSNERKVDLNIGGMGMPRLDEDRQMPREKPDDALTDRFRDALNRGEQDREQTASDDQAQSSDQGQGEEQQEQPESAPVANPFSLFGAGLFKPAAVAATEGKPLAPARLDDVQDSVQKLLVSQGVDGSREVRLELKAEVLPGTELRIAQHDGRLQIEFVVTDPNSLSWLTAQATSLAEKLGNRLNKQIRIRVRHPEATGDAAAIDGDPGNVQATEERSLGGPASLFGRWSDGGRS